MAQVEAMVARKAVELALETGFTRVVIEGDSDTIYKELSSIDPSLALHVHVIHQGNNVAMI